MPQSFASLHVHLIFSTKARAPLITPELQPRLYEYIGGIFKNHGGMLRAVGGIADHVHILADLTRDMSVSEAVRLVKSNSSKWVNEEFEVHRGFSWQAGYGAFSVSPSNMPAVGRYIADQESHHRTRTFQEEFVEFLERPGTEYDERYIWD